MTSKYSCLLLLILCAGLVCGLPEVSAQTGGKVLVAGAPQLRQSDVDALVEFYEWALDLKFTGGQRAKFQSVTEADFRNDPATARKGIDDLLDMSAKVKAMDESAAAKCARTSSPSSSKDCGSIPTTKPRG